MKILVTGACGWIGRKVCEYLSAQGVEVVGADVIPVNSVWLIVNGGFLSAYVQIDITRPIEKDLTSDLGSPLSEINAVIHCAGYAHRPNETPEEQKLFYAVNRDGTKHVLDWCARNDVNRFLYVSSIAFYNWDLEGRRPRRPDVRSERPRTLQVSEDHPISLPTHYAKSKYEGEQLVRSSSLDWRVVRLATVFGEGDRANFSRMANAMKKRIFPIPGRGGARKSVIPVDLAAELIAEFALMNKPSHQLINLGLPAAPSLKEICSAYHEVCGLPKCPTIPMPLAKGLGRCGDLAAKILGKFPFTSDTLRKLTTDTVVSVARMQECFPDREFGSFQDYLAACAEWYKSRKRDGFKS